MIKLLQRKKYSILSPRFAIFVMNQKILFNTLVLAVININALIVLKEAFFGAKFAKGNMPIVFKMKYFCFTINQKLTIWKK